MVQVLVISDTHGSQSYINQMLEIAHRLKPELIYHLGDDYVDAEVFIKAGFSVVRVPGTWTPEYQDVMIDNRRFEDLEGWRLFLTHTPDRDRHDLPDDVDPQRVVQNKECHLVLHGHLHKPDLYQENGVWILNPGHLYEKDNRGYSPSYAILNVSQTELHVRIIGLLDSVTFLDSKITRES